MGSRPKVAGSVTARCFWREGFEAAFGSERRGEKGLHSFRHLFERTLRDAGVSDSLQFSLGGWADKKANNFSVEYGDGFGAKPLKEAIDRVEFPGVDFSPLYGNSDAQ